MLKISPSSFLFALAIIPTSCSPTQILQEADQIISDAFIRNLGVQGVNTSHLKPNKVKLSKSGDVIDLKWSGSTISANMGEGWQNLTSKRSGVYVYNPDGTKHYNLEMDFNRSVYQLDQFDGAWLPSEKGTLIIAR